MQFRAILSLGSWIVATAMVVPRSANATDYTEIGSGDLSGNRLAPTSWNLSAGINRLIASTSPGDQEYVRINLPTGHRLSSIVLQIYTMSDMMFIGVQQGTTFTVEPAQATAGDMFGYAHFGTEAGNVGADILDDMGQAAGAIGFIPPLVSGSYTFWLQQGTPGITTYQLNFGVLRPGDYNGDGSVNATDYVVWRNTVGSTTDFHADGTGPSGTPDRVIDRLDYNYWKQHYGEGSGSGTDATNHVPEPTAVECLLGALLISAATPVRKRRRHAASR
jgi:hypothetical protein